MTLSQLIPCGDLKNLEYPSSEILAFTLDGISRQGKERLKVSHCHQSLFPSYKPPVPLTSTSSYCLHPTVSSLLQTEVRHWDLFQRLRAAASRTGTEIRHSGRRVICDLCQRSEKPEAEVGYLNPLQGLLNLSPKQLQRLIKTWLYLYRCFSKV